MAAWEDRRVSRVCCAVRRDLTKRYTLADAARLAGLEAVYFSKLFRKATGETFSSWSARVRVEEAKSLLSIVDMSITAIAVSVGYTDVTTFERAFRKIERVSPRRFRTQEFGKAEERQETPNSRQETPKTRQGTPRPSSPR